jgi:hypothetical protein
LQILTSNFVSIIYYNFEVWMLKSLKANLKLDLPAASANSSKNGNALPQANDRVFELAQNHQ